MSAPPNFFYEAEGEGFAPSSLVPGPWNPAHQGGVPLAGLVAHLVEDIPTTGPMIIARLVIDILRPTPMDLIVPRSRIVREGRRLQWSEVELFADGQVTVRAAAMRVRVAEGPVSPGMASPQPLQPPPAQGPGLLAERSRLRHLADTRLISGGLEKKGPGEVWVKLDGEVVRGKPASPLARAAMVADFGSGLSAFVDWREWSFANVDITLHLARAPRGDWLKLQARSLSAGEGVAVVDGDLWDLHGPVGKTHQTLFLERQAR